MPSNLGLSGHWRLLLLALVLAWFAAIWPRLGLKECYEWDAAQFGLATRHYSIREHQPHPPGYWLYVQLLKPAAAAAGDAMVAMGYLSLGMTLAAVWVLGRWRGLPAAAALAFSPIVLFLAPSQTTYIAEALTSLAAAWLTARVIEGETRLLPWLFGWTCLLAGLRPNTLVYCLPLLALALYHSRQEWRRYWWRAVLAGAAAVLFWLIPQVANAGSWDEYLKLTRGQFNNSASGTSIFYGAPLNAQIQTTVWALTWLSFAVAPMLVVGLRARSLDGNAPWYRWWFFAAWMLPAAMQVELVHSPKAGYVAFLIPPFAVFISKGLSLRRAAVIAALCLVATFLPNSFFQLPHMPGFLSPSLGRAKPSYQFEIEAIHLRLRTVLAPIAPGTLGIVASGRIRGTQPKDFAMEPSTHQVGGRSAS